ncbi:MAG: hypothetical protein J6L60_10525, partial [Bacteroidaceae bacterium]|nr:hypothetical protein [Bacteroidaceae bacterium]
ASKCHAELVSASGSEPYLVLLRGQILKQVQDDHLLWAIVICYIEEQKSIICLYVLLSKNKISSNNHRFFKTKIWKKNEDS